MISALKDSLAKRELEKLASASLDCKNFSTAKNSTLQIAILYPHKREQVGEADNVLKLVFDFFPRAEFTMIKPYDFPKEKLAFSGLPNDLFFSEYTQKSYDILIDLSDGFELVACYIAAKLSADMRVRFYNDEQSDAFYHFTFLAQKNGLHESVSKFLKTFAHLKQSKLLRESVSN